MPHERRPPDDPREWINRARSNLVRAQTILPGVYLEDLCFDAQQAAEKAIKAVLIARGVDFPLIHDLAQLLTLLGQSGETIPPAIADATDLTRFAISARYPGVAEPVTVEEHHRAVAIAKAVVTWADERVGEGSSSTR
jgi:HEPN domain-containing protein